MASRQASALLEDEEEEYLRPEVPAAPMRRRRAERPDPSEEAEAFLRSRRRGAPQRKRGLLRTMLGSRAGRWALGGALLLLVAAGIAAAWAVRSFLEHDPHFRIDSSSDIQTVGGTELSRDELLHVFSLDIGRNLFFVPLKQREGALEAEPWVAHATVMRLLPHTIRVSIVERTPVAFARVGREIELVDAEGVLLPVAPSTLAARHYSFPVVTGLDPKATPGERAAQMQLFARFVKALGNNPELSEVDLGDTDDVRAVVPAQGTDILLHFGNTNFAARWASYKEHIAAWRQQYPALSAVDLRYEQQVVLKMADAAQADQSAEGKPLAQDAGPSPRPVSTPAEARPASQPDAKHTVKHHDAKSWRAHFIPHAGRGQ